MGIKLKVYDCLEEVESLGLIKMVQPIGDKKERKRRNLQTTEYNKYSITVTLN